MLSLIHSNAILTCTIVILFASAAGMPESVVKWKTKRKSTVGISWVWIVCRNVLACILFSRFTPCQPNWMENEMQCHTARISRLHARMETECKEYSRRLQLKHNSLHFHWREMVFLSRAVWLTGFVFCLHLSVHFHRRRHCGIWPMVPRCQSMLAWISYETWAKRISLCLQCGKNNFQFHCYTYVCGEHVLPLCLYSIQHSLWATMHSAHAMCSTWIAHVRRKISHQSYRILCRWICSGKNRIYSYVGIHEVTKAFTQSGGSNELCRKPQCAGEIMSRPIWKWCLSSSVLCPILSPNSHFPCTGAGPLASR